MFDMNNPYLHKGHSGHFLNTVICKWFFLINSLSIVMIIFEYVQNWQHYSRIFSLSFYSLVSTFTCIISLSGKVPGYFQTFQSLLLYSIFSLTLDRMKTFQNRFMNQSFFQTLCNQLTYFRCSLPFLSTIFSALTCVYIFMQRYLYAMPSYFYHLFYRKHIFLGVI